MLYIDDFLLFHCKIYFNFTECTSKVVYSQVTKSRVKISLLVFMSEIKMNLTLKKVKSRSLLC